MGYARYQYFRIPGEANQVCKATKPTDSFEIFSQRTQCSPPAPTGAGVWLKKRFTHPFSHFQLSLASPHQGNADQERHDVMGKGYIDAAHMEPNQDDQPGEVPYNGCPADPGRQQIRLE